MSIIKKLAGQTAIYGIPGILGRILGYLLVPLYTRVFLPDEYGVVNVFYSYAAFLMVVLTYGMETAFFRFHQQESDRDKVFGTGMISILGTSVLFLFFIISSSGRIAQWIDYPDNRNYVTWFGWILVLDTLASLPFARLRAQNRPARFASVKMAGIITNILLNVFFIILCPVLERKFEGTSAGDLLKIIYKADWGIEYIFISNLVSSGLVLVLLLPEIVSARWKTDLLLWRKMIVYAFPLLFAGMAGIINETFDRLLLRYLLPEEIANHQVGIYSACYKISILMTIFIQAYRYAAEPFFFAQAREKNAADVYSQVMNYFMIIVSLIFLVTMVYLDDFIMPFLVGKNYWEGKTVIPVLMLANLFLGVYYNLSVWYKITGKTIWGAWFSVAGAVITLVLNFLWIPLSPDHLIYGYYGSAWATFICYAIMMILSYVVGQRHMPVRYDLRKFFGYLGFALLLYLITILIRPEIWIVSFLFHSMLILIYLVVVISFEKPGWTRTFRVQGIK